MSKYLDMENGKFFYKQLIKPESSDSRVVEASAHHTFIIDCSGSMWGELSQIKKDLYNKIATMLKPNDSVTIIWFSGRGEFGVLLEDYRVSSAISLAKVKELIDKYLVTVGLTAFKEPLIELKNVIKRVGDRNKDMIHTMFFLTDGHDNCWSPKEIMSAIQDVKEDLSSATIVEYGWYCNKKLLNDMATSIGGVHTFSEGFDDYEPYAEKVFSGANSVKRRYIQLDEVPYGGIVFNIVDGDVIAYSPNENNEIFVGVDGELNLFYVTDIEPNSGNLIGNSDFVSSAVISGDVSDVILGGLYGAAFSFSRADNYDMVSEILKFLGDAYFITQKSNTFGTQKINELESKFLDSMNNASSRFIEGYNPDLEPAEDAFCVMDMLDLLMDSEENVWYPRHDSFKYKRTGGKAVAKKQGITQDSKDEIKNLADSGDISALKTKIQEIEDSAVEAIEFKFKEENPSSPISRLTWNDKRANLSVSVEYEGYVNIPDNEFGLDTVFPTKIFRNYTIIKDGVIHTYELPVSLNKETFDTLQSNGLLNGETWEQGKIMILNFSEIPVINRKMVESLSAVDMFKESYELIKNQASAYVFGQYKKNLFDGASKNFLDLYGVDATNWLKELGLRDYGFNPPSTVEKMNEEIEVNTLEVKIKGLSSAPAKKDFDALEPKVNSEFDPSKLTNKEALMYPAIKEFKTFKESISNLKPESQDLMLKEWVYGKLEASAREKSKLMMDISKSKFLTIIGKKWFKEFNSREENELELLMDGNSLTFTVIDKQTTIKL